jgi:hypothetical protein
MPVGDKQATDVRVLGADDGIRTRDPHLGKVVLYQLSHVRARTGAPVRTTSLGAGIGCFNRSPRSAAR